MKTIKLLGRDLPRMGFGAMRLPGPGVFGPPADRAAALAVLRRAYALGVRVIDTAWYYGPFVSNELIAEALRPYPSDLLLITKLGHRRGADGSWIPAHSPAELRAGMAEDLRTLKIDAGQIVHLRWEGEALDEPFEQAVDAMLRMQKDGMLHHIGLSNVTPAQIAYTRKLTPVVTISNAYSVMSGVRLPQQNQIIDFCARENIAYLPFGPLAVNAGGPQKALRFWAEQLQATPTQIILAATLARSPAMLPIPGTSSVRHLEENWAAAHIDLPPAARAALLQDQ